jgi:hypothetical protein
LRDGLKPKPGYTLARYAASLWWMVCLACWGCS